jgi:phage antirepressor YoqD-like protein
MTIFEAIDRIERIHKLIKLESTGTPEELAKRLNIKKRQLHNILCEFKCFGAEIRYNRYKQTYYYENNFELIFKYKVINAEYK